MKKRNYGLFYIKVLSVLSSIASAGFAYIFVSDLMTRLVKLSDPYYKTYMIIGCIFVFGLFFSLTQVLVTFFQNIALIAKNTSQNLSQNKKGKKK